MVTRILSPVRILRPEFITGGCVLELKMDEGEGVVVRDSSGYGNHGNLKPGPAPNYPSWVDGKFGKALSFDGVDDYVNCGNATSLDGFTAFTVEAWVNADVVLKDKNEVIVGKGWEGADDAYNLSWDHTDVGMHFIVKTNVGEKYVTALNPPIISGWHHIVGVYDGSSIKIYINGSLDNSLSHSGTVLAIPTVLTIGNLNPTNTAHLLGGLIDEVRIYNRALSAAEIQKHYAEGLEKHKNLAIK